MVYIVVPEERLFELFRLPKRTIVDRLVQILRECDHCASGSETESDGDCDQGSVTTEEPACDNADADDEAVELPEHLSGPILSD